MIIGITTTETDNRVQIILKDEHNIMQADFSATAARKIAARILNAADEAEQ